MTAEAAEFRMPLRGHKGAAARGFEPAGPPPCKVLRWQYNSTLPAQNIGEKY